MRVIDQKVTNEYAMYNGDSVEIIQALPDDSIHYTLFSPPFASLYTYSNSDRDMGNCKGDDEFYQQFKFLVTELYRVTMPGRLLSFHCMNLPMMKSRDGVIGIKDFRGDLIKMFVDAGFIYHSEVCIWKNPVTEMQRTKSIGLLHKQIKKDSAMSRQGLPDYVVTMRKPGDNPQPIKHTDENFPVGIWQQYASPVWMDIQQSNTLNRKGAREEQDEKHICLAEGTLILTKRGYIPIESIDVANDEVLTNSGEWHRVLAKAKTRENADVVRINAQGVPHLILTPDHKVMAKKPDNAWKPKDSLANVGQNWTEAKDLDGCYVKSVLPPIMESNINDTEWWMIGRWIADERVVDKDSGEPVERIALSDEAREIINKIGTGAEKKLPVECVSLNHELSKALFDGYISGNGHRMEGDKIIVTSASRGLLLGMSMVCQKVTGKVASIYPEQEEWAMAVSLQDNSMESETAWKKVKKIVAEEKRDVWSLEVEEDHSYMAEGCIVKNCPLQLDLIERCIKLWTNPGDIVLDPFAGIGSVPYEAVLLHRRGLGFELKSSYFEQSILNMDNAIDLSKNVKDYGIATIAKDEPQQKKKAVKPVVYDGDQIDLYEWISNWQEEESKSALGGMEMRK